MGESTQSATTLTHRGESLRLSLPRNDYREVSHHFRGLDEQPESLEIESALQFPAHTIDIFPDNGNDQEMRVICAISDRVQWDQRIRLVRERKLQEMGVSAISNIAYNPRIVQHKAPPISAPLSHGNAPFWTGLHTPAISTDAPSIEYIAPFEDPIAQAVLHHEVKTTRVSDSLSQQIAALQARHHQISKSVSEIMNIEDQNMSNNTHTRGLSQRELVHRRLSSIAPVVLRKSSRIVTPISMIPEEPDVGLEADLTGPEMVFEQDDGRDALLMNNPFRLHQHLASNDMSELIKIQPTHYVPDFDCQYESFQWGDEPMADPSGNCLNGLYYPPTTIPHYQDMFHGQNSTYHQQTGSLQGPLYFYPQASTSTDPLPMTDTQNSLYEFVGHEAQKSVFNTNADSFVPFSQAIVKPSIGSKAIPIVRPPEADGERASIGDGCGEQRNVEESLLKSSSNTVFDAYNGFDSGSEKSVESDVEPDFDTSQVSITVQDEADQGAEANDERVKSFKFPSPEKPVTLTRKRSRILDSESPKDRRMLARTSVLTAKMSSTPRKSPRIFQKSVALEDNELDSIIMDLSIRDLPVPDSSSDEDQSDSSMLSESENGQRPTLRRTVSTKLLLSHQDADVGLLLDAMLSAKLAVVTESLSNLQTSVMAITEEIQSMSTTTPNTTIEMLGTIRHELAETRLLSFSAAKDNSLEEQIIALNATEAHNSTIMTQLRQELAVATSDLAEIKISLQNAALDQVTLNPNEHGHVNSQGVHKLQIVDAAKLALQRSVGELTTKAARLEGQLHESMTFCSALQSQYSSSELSLAKLRKELNEIQTLKDESVEECDNIKMRHASLQQQMEEAAVQIADEQFRWYESDSQKDQKILELKECIAARSSVAEDDTSRRSSTTSIVGDARMTHFLMDRVKALEISNKHLQTSHRDELAVRDDRFEKMLHEWQHMTKQLVISESTVDNLRAELVMSTEFGDRMIDDLKRANNLVDVLSAQIRNSGPVSILKRSKSNSEVKRDSAAAQEAELLLVSLAEKDQRIAELERLLNAPFESTERQILHAVSDSILNTQLEPATASVLKPAADIQPHLTEGKDAQSGSTESFQERMRELKRMRMSWEAKTPEMLSKLA